MRRVLIVDDEVSYREALATVLPHEGFEARAVATAKEALEVAAQFKPDVLVVDWVLRQGEDGLELASQLAKMFPALRVIVISGYPNSQLKLRLHNLPGTQLLPKPFHLRRLFDALRTLESDA